MSINGLNTCRDDDDADGDNSDDGIEYDGCSANVGHDDENDVDDVNSVLVMMMMRMRMIMMIVIVSIIMIILL